MPSRKMTLKSRLNIHIAVLKNDKKSNAQQQELSSLRSQLE